MNSTFGCVSATTVVWCLHPSDSSYCSSSSNVFWCKLVVDFRDIAGPLQQKSRLLHYLGRGKVGCMIWPDVQFVEEVAVELHHRSFAWVVHIIVSVCRFPL
jgi:hypothetical protein